MILLLRNAKNKLNVLFVFFIFISKLGLAQEQYTSQLDKLFSIANKENKTLENANIQKELADLTTKIAKVSAFNPRVPVSYQAVDNLKLQNVFVPGGIFGQTEGTFQSFKMGQKYVATFSVQPQFDILNFSAKSESQKAKINQELEFLNEKKTQRDYYSQINSAYHNILSFEGQKIVLNQTLDHAKKIAEIVKNRFEEGIVRPQDLNEAKVNVINIEDNIFQIEQNVLLQKEILKVLIGNDIMLDVKDSLYLKDDIILAESVLEYQWAEKKMELAKKDFLLAKRDNLPTLSFFSSFNWQNLSNNFYYSSNANSINYSSIGLRLNWDLPTTAQKFGNLKNKEFLNKIAKNDLEIISENEKLNDFQRQNDLTKSKGQWLNKVKIENLKQDIYSKQLSLFEEQVLSLDQLLISQNDYLLSRINTITSAANVSFNYHQIRIFNLF